MNQAKFKNTLSVETTRNGWGLVEILVLIVIIGILLLVLLKGITTSVVVVKDIDSNEQVTALSTNYLNRVIGMSRKVEYYDDLAIGDFPPIPLTSDYTASGKYTAYVETEKVDSNSKKVSITYQPVSSTSFDDPIVTLSTIIEAP